MLPVQNSQFEPLQQSAHRWSNRLKQGVAVCNSLVFINKSTVVGADMERSMFKAVEARFLVSYQNLVVLTKYNPDQTQVQQVIQDSV